MTYRLDSDFKMPYGQILPTRPVPNEENPEEFERMLVDFGRDNAAFVKKPEETKVAWFVSNCETMSQREKFVSALQKYIEVSQP